jgi:hypothetical protein
VPDSSYNMQLGDVPDGRSNAAIDMANDLVDDLANTGGPLPEPDALVYEHPDYRQTKPKWAKYQRLYNSKDIYQYIFQHTREHKEMFEKRVARGHFLNYVSAVVDLFVAYLYHAPITRQPGTATLFEPLYVNADRRGTMYSVFIQQATTHAQVAGHCGILVDLPKLDTPLESEAEREEKDHRPYLALIKAHQILDWELDASGNFLWVKLEIVESEERDWKTKVDETVRYFVIWTRDSWEKFKVYQVEENGQKVDKVESLGSGPNKVGRVPLVIMRNERDLDHEWFGSSAVRDIADINIAILNWSSLMDEEIYERCLNILCAQKAGNDGNSSIEISHNNVIEYEGEQPPNYLTPGATPLDLIMKAIDRNKDEIYRLAKLGGDTGLQKSRQATSGIAYAFEFNTTNQSLGKKAEAAQQAEIEIHRLVAAWVGEEFKGNITYPKEFGVEDFLTDLALLAEGRATLSSPTAIKELEKRISAKMFAREPQAIRDKISREVESQDPKDPMLLNSSLGFGPEPPGSDEDEEPVGGGDKTSSDTGKSGDKKPLGAKPRE